MEDFVLKNSIPFCSHLAVLAGICAAATIALWPRDAGAQIKEPGAHGSHSVELEPHGVIYWDGRGGGPYYDGGGTGYGLGMRATIPIVQNGFVSSINNSVGIGFGLDWGHWGNLCKGFGDCSFTEYNVPVVMQWNFYVTKSFTAFGEPGLAIRHGRVKAGDYSASDTDFDPVFFAGGRLGNDSIAFTFRVGWPYASAGCSFFF